MTIISRKHIESTRSLEQANGQARTSMLWYLVYIEYKDRPSVSLLSVRHVD